MKITENSLSKVNCEYGCPLGRRNNIPDKTLSPKLNLLKLRWYDGDYTKDGTYWGNGSNDFIYWAQGDGFSIFERGSNREKIKELIRKIVPKARFYR